MTEKSKKRCGEDCRLFFEVLEKLAESRERLLILKIAMIGQKKVPSRLGGVEVAVEALAVRMAARGHQVTLYNCYRRGLRKEKGVKRRWKYKGVWIREVMVPNIRGISTVWGTFVATVLAVIGKYDCIHYHAEGPAAMAVFPKLFGIRTIVTIHGLDWKRSKWGSGASWYLRHGEKTAVLCADEIIVLSESAHKYFMEQYHRDTIVIPNGIERPEKYEANLITQYWGLERDKYILYLGRIVPEKGIENLIRAYLKVKTDKKLVIAGGESDTKTFYKKMQEIAKEDSRILFTGFVGGKVLGELYSNCYLYCLPSELEGMPLSLLEALSYGCCCLCSDISECTEVLQNKGFLFEKQNASDLGRMLQILCDDSQKVERSREMAVNSLFENYDWEKITEETLALYCSKEKRHK